MNHWQKIMKYAAAVDIKISKTKTSRKFTSSQFAFKVTFAEPKECNNHDDFISTQCQKLL